MFSLNNGRPLRYPCSSFGAVLFHYTVIIFLLTDSCSGQSQEDESPQTITALVGEDVNLPCHLEPAVDVVSMSLEWGRPDLEPRFVHVWHEGKNLPGTQNPSYKDRTSLSTEKLKHGDLSLTLSAVKHSDNGKYRCYFPSQAKSFTVDLIVGSVSSPVMTGININSNLMVLQCESKGWYPEPEVLWLDSEGNLLSAGPTETVRGPDDLYTVSSRVTVEKRHSNNITCRVQQRNINQTRETQFEVSGECLIATSCSAARVSIILITVFILISAAAFGLWKWRQNRIKEDRVHEHETEQKEAEQFLLDITKKEDLEENKSKHDEELQKKEEEEKQLTQVVNMLMEQKNELQKLKDQLTCQSNNMDTEKDDIEKKLQSVEKETERDRAKGYLELKEIILKAKQQLMNRKQEHEKLQLITHTLLNRTDGLVNNMTGEQINKENQSAT